MALKATIYKATVNVADLDRNQFLDVSLTLAQHPSETQERMMLRLLAWMKYADERLQFTRGLSSDDEAELWLLNDHLGVDLWIELGLPDERRIKKACSRAQEVALFAYNSRAAEIWWQQNKSKMAQFSKLTVWYLDDTRWRSSVLLPIGQCRYRRLSRMVLSGYLTLRIIWKFI